MNQNDDPFARIALRRVVEQSHLLIEPQPPALPPTFLPAGKHNPRAAFQPLPKLDTPQKLQRELARQRKRFARFLRVYAPDLPATREITPLTSFDWRMQTDADAHDFNGVLIGRGNWEQVSIPHYGGPIGKATAYYRTTFELDLSSAQPALFVRFKGVDYKAHVFVNGAYLGSHEGFFAPFEFDFTRVARDGRNTLVVVVENDAIMLGNDSWDPLIGITEYHEGDKIYAATGLGWDDPVMGWHHCPPGMGISQDVFIEARAPIHIHDVWVRPLPAEGRAEAWIEVRNTHAVYQPIAISLSVFGENFNRVVFRDRAMPNVPDAGPGVSYYRFSFDMPNARIWELDAPWLYQLQVTLRSPAGELTDARCRMFGMRSFRMDTSADADMRGRMYFNEREIRLRGSNTMGFEQQDVYRKDWGQLIDDILLARICHMNYWRLTQRPVQDEVYDMCDRLGFLTQTDLPLFGQVRRNQFTEVVRQAEEMERLVRGHACNIMVSYINEPFPNANGRAHRHLTRPEMESLFIALNQAVLLANPDRVIKAVDGDYDPPNTDLPDNHCYTGWYNGHGVDMGKLHRGYWQKVKPGWMYGCGEFGAEGLDTLELMRKYYPSEWLPTSDDDANWSPNQISSAQTGRYHYMFFETPHTPAEWCRESRRHQAWATRVMTEAFRRDSHMNSIAIHLFIDAFPDAWMKVIMDYERQPKPSFFAYREALTPLMANLRADRHAWFAGEEMQVEAWVCNDTHDAPRRAVLRYQLELNGKVIFAQRAPARIEPCSSAFQGFIKLPVPALDAPRGTLTLRLALALPDGTLLHDTALDFDVFQQPIEPAAPVAHIIGARAGKAAQLARELGLRASTRGAIKSSSAILIDDMAAYTARADEVDAAVRKGARAVFLELPAGAHSIAGQAVAVAACGMGGVHFASRDTGHPLVDGFAPYDFKFWYDAAVDRPTPLLENVLELDGWTPVLNTGNGGWQVPWHAALAAAELRVGEGAYRICQVKLAGRLDNPVARIFAGRLVR